jgi:ketosteroid isomerase-like protein
MSQENVEIVRACFHAWNAGDFAALRELVHRDVILRSPEGWPESGPFVGRAAVIRGWEQLREAWDTVTHEPVTDFLAAGDRVVVRSTLRGIGQGPEFHQESTIIFTVRKGQVLVLDFFWDHEEALKASGLEE